MNIFIFAIGKESSAETLELQKRYEQRLKPYATIEWKILPGSKAETEDQVRNQESESLLNQLKPTDSVVLLDERGKQQTNAKFAQTFERLASSQGRLIFIIGGAFGVNDKLRARASFVWSLSDLVFPHQLVRVLLLEQIYRTYMVLANHPYHHF